MGNIHRAMGSGTAVQDLLFGRLVITQKFQYQRRNIDLFCYNSPWDGSVFKRVQQKPIIIIITIIIIIIIIKIIIIIEVTHSKTIRENTVEIEPQTVALDF